MALLEKMKRLVGYESQTEVYNYECQYCGLDFQCKFTGSTLTACPHCGAHNAPARDES